MSWAPNASLFGGFASLVSTAFAVYGTSEAAKLVLLEARPAPPAVPGAEDDGNERFSLFFCGSNREPLEQDTYVFEHPRMGRMPIFITRIGSMDTTHCYYEAVFNHPVSPWGVAAQLSRAPRSVTND